MSQPEISPLARRLAEENNVDWRGLHGSGAGGKVVERDVLEYLARVMAGEEDLDPTPEPVPDGMEEWPEEDVRSFQSDVQASAKGGGLQEIQQELSASDRLGRDGVEVPTPPAMPAEPSWVNDDPPLLEGDEPGDAMVDDGMVDDGMVDDGMVDDGMVGDGISEDIFLFDEDEGSDESADAGLELPGIDLGSAPSTGAAGSDELTLQADSAASWNGDLDEDGDLGEDGDTLWAGVSPEGGVETLPDVFGDAGRAEPEPDILAASEALFGGGSADGDDGFAAADTRAGADGVGADSFDSDSVAAVGGAAGDLEVPPLGDLDIETPSPAAFPAAFPAASPAAAPVEPMPEPMPEPTTAPESFEPTTPDLADLAADASRFDAGEAVPDIDSRAPAGPPDVVPAADVAPDVIEEVPGELPLVSYGTLLRRHVDVTALAGAQLAVGLEMGESEPLPAAPFLLRAAAKAVADGGWGEGAVAMVGLTGPEGVRVGTIDGAASRPFVELARALNAELARAAGSTTEAGLAVADMSALEVDEAVLRLGAPLLTLGRILYDNQRGSYRSTLSLSGEVTPEAGARLLARVAELLDAPVRLLL